MTKLVWMSDPHFAHEGTVLGHDPRARLRAAIDHINTHHADAELCVISGDMVNRGTAQDYAALRTELDALAMPYAPMMGNHDTRDLLRAALPLPDTCMDGFVQYEIETADGLILCLDTHRTGSDAGEFCADRRDWLRARLQDAGDRPAYLFVHHPPMALGLPAQDTENMTDGPGFLDLVQAHPATRHLFIGHVHRAVTGSVRGIPFATMRSVLFQAPPPRPTWDWSTFKPGQEAPCIGVVFLSEGDVTIQIEEIIRQHP